MVGVAKSKRLPAEMSSFTFNMMQLDCSVVVLLSAQTHQLSFYIIISDIIKTSLLIFSH